MRISHLVSTNFKDEFYVGIGEGGSQGAANITLSEHKFQS